MISLFDGEPTGDEVRIVVMSDSHSRPHPGLKDALPRNYNRIIHCGDFSETADYELFSSWGEFDGVAGNMESSELHRRLTEDLTITISATKVYVRHEVDPSEFARVVPRTQQPDVVLFGHTHVPMIKQIGGTLFLNPGSVSSPRCKVPPSFAELRIRGGKAKALLRFID